ncbi:MAG: Lrp/AsnC family transcriptional regulator [Gemmobacter sp.]
MRDHIDPGDLPLLQDFQRDLPLVPQPFAEIGRRLGMAEAEVLARLIRLRGEGKVARVGATVRPNTAGASTLAALAVPGKRIEAVAAIVGAEPGVNHSYQRDHRWNLWFVATAPDATALAATLDRIGRRTGRPVLDLPLLRAFNIDLGFRLRGPRHGMGADRPADLDALCDGDRPILDRLSGGLDLVPAPFAALAATLGRTEAEVIGRIAALSEAGILTRAGVIVRHRPLGWSANAMVAFDVPDDRAEAAGLALAAHPGVTLCYRRRTVPGVWPYGLFCMIHARTRAEAEDVLDGARRLPALSGAPHQVLFSLRCFKQTGARLMAQEEAA